LLQPRRLGHLHFPRVHRTLSQSRHHRAGTQLGRHRRPGGVDRTSDEEATHWLLLDRQDRKLSILNQRQAARLLGEQWLEAAVPHAPAPPLEVESLTDILNLARWQEVEVSMAEIEQHVQRRQEVLRQMAELLNGYAK
jgi:hypothetical protein